MKRYINSRWIRMADGKWNFQFLVEWEGYDNHTWESREQIEKDAQGTEQEPGKDNGDFNMEEEFYLKHPNAPHHNNPILERTEWQKVTKRRKGKAPIWQTRKN